MTSGGLGEVLAAVNASLNALSATLIVFGWRAIRAGLEERHRRFMMAAFCSSAVFLVVYVLRMSLTGTHRFVGEPWLRATYLVILFSHVTLAMAIVPLVLRTIYLAVKDRRAEHVRIVRFTLPIWLYVSVTGVVIYLMLYHLSG